MTQRVAITKVDEGSIEAAVREAIALAGSLEELIKSDSRVLIKPNVCMPAPSGSGVVADARVTEAVARIVLELGPRSVVVGDGSIAGYDVGGGYSTEEAFETSGTAEVARRLGIELRNLNSDSFVEVTIHKPLVMDKVRIARTAL